VLALVVVIEDVIEEMINDIFVDEDITIVRYVPSK
jgi:hypothetical protein